MFLSDNWGVHIQPGHVVEAKLNGKQQSGASICIWAPDFKTAFFFPLVNNEEEVNKYPNEVDISSWSCNISNQQNRQWKNREWLWKERQKLERKKNKVWGRWWWRGYWVVLGVCHTKTEAVKWC